MNIEERPCRICLCEDDINDFIVPCLCKGSMIDIHRKCLNTQRASNLNKNIFTHCPQCKFEYLLDIDDDKKNEKIRKLKYYLYNIRDIILCFLILTFLVFIIKNCIKIESSISEIPYDSPWLYSIMTLLCIIGFAGYIMMIVSGGDRTGTNITIPKNNEVLVFAIIGAICVIFMGIYVIGERLKINADWIWKKQETDKFRVKDLSKI